MAPGNTHHSDSAFSYCNHQLLELAPREFTEPDDMDYGYHHRSDSSHHQESNHELLLEVWLRPEATRDQTQHLLSGYILRAGDGLVHIWKCAHI